MDVKQIDKLEALLAKATPGPWTIKEDKIIPESHVRRHFGGSIDPVRDTAFAWPIASLRRDSLPRWTEETTEANAELIAAAINALPALLALAEAWETVRGDLRMIYDAIPGLPITPETCEQATDALTTFCKLIGALDIDKEEVPANGEA